MNTALVLAQMKKLNKLILKKLFKYQKEFEKDLNFKIMKEPSIQKSNYYSNSIFKKHNQKFA